MQSRSTEKSEESQSCQHSAEPVRARPEVASLLPFPAKLQQVIIGAVLETTPQRATDIWQENESTGETCVMRHGMHWQLNATAAMLWARMGECMADVVKDFCAKFPDSDAEEIKFWAVEFLLNASSSGLVELFPEGLSGAQE